MTPVTVSGANRIRTCDIFTASEALYQAEL
jgi:hypothetical protein